MSLKAKIEAVVYAAETPVTLEQIFQLVKESVVAEQEGLDEAGAKAFCAKRTGRTGRGVWYL